MTTTPNLPAPLGAPRVWPYALAFYGLPHCSAAFRATWAGKPAAGKPPGRCREQAAWLRMEYAQAAA